MITNTDAEGCQNTLQWEAPMKPKTWRDCPT